MANTAMKAYALESAFDVFNQQSSMLETTYRELQEKVSVLSERLAKAEKSKGRQLLEKEQLSQRLLRLLEVLPAAVIVIDGDGIVRECNRRSVELLNTPLLDCAWSVIVQRECSRGESRNGDLKLNNGRWLSLSRQSIGTEPGEILLLADVSESRRTTELLQRRERLLTLGEMTAKLGHQIRTPLASALLYASTMTEAGTAEQQAAADNILRRLRDLGGMVDDMLSYVAGVKESGEIVSVASLLHAVAELIAPQLAQGGKIHIEVADPDLKVIANNEALKGALMNLVINAIQAADDKPSIELCAVTSDNHICLTVTDDGPGINESIRSRLFEPFFTTRPQGTGLGLAVVRSVAEAHGGEVLLDCGPQGTAFSICLPRKTELVEGAGNAECHPMSTVDE